MALDSFGHCFCCKFNCHVNAFRTGTPANRGLPVLIAFWALQFFHDRFLFWQPKGHSNGALLGTLAVLGLAITGFISTRLAITHCQNLCGASFNSLDKHFPLFVGFLVCGVFHCGFFIVE